MLMHQDNGIANVASKHSVEETANRFSSLLQAKGVKLFASIDHSGEAEEAGLSMPPTKLLIFGNPKAGTPVMLAAPTSALDLPLKVLVWADIAGKVWLSYNTPKYLEERHGLTAELTQNLAVVDGLVAQAAA